MAKKKKAVVAEAPSTSPDWYFIGALGCALLVVAVQLVGIRMPLAGYHGFNEGFYFTHALTDAGRSLADQLLRPIDLNNPPLYPLVLAAVLRAFGETVLVGRLLGVVLSVALVLLTFWVARALYNSPIALLATAMAAVSPGVLMTGRNMQVDTLMVVFVLAGLGCYLKAVPADDRRWAIAAGACFGASFLVKLPAVLAVIALVVWRLWSRGRDLSWVTRRSTWLTAGVAALVGVPWHLYSLLTKAGYSSAQSSLAETGAWKGWAFIWEHVIVEAFWMLTPLVAIAAIVGIGVAATKRSSADKLVLSLIGVHAVFFLFFNFHSYYLIALLPFAVMAGARGTWTIFSPEWRQQAIAIALVMVVTLPLTMLVLSSKKWTMLRLDEAPAVLERAGYAPGDTTVGEWAEINGRHGPAVGYYFERAGYPPLVPYSALPSEAAPEPGTRLVALADGLGDAPPGTTRIAPLRLTLASPVVAGYAVRMQPAQIHYFAPGAVSVERVGPAWWFGAEWATIDDSAHVLLAVE